MGDGMSDYETIMVKARQMGKTESTFMVDAAREVSSLTEENSALGQELVKCYYEIASLKEDLFEARVDRDKYYERNAILEDCLNSVREQRDLYKEFYDNNEAELVIARRQLKADESLVAGLRDQINALLALPREAANRHD